LLLLPSLHQAAAAANAEAAAMLHFLS